MKRAAKRKAKCPPPDAEATLARGDRRGAAAGGAARPRAPASPSGSARSAGARPARRWRACSRPQPKLEALLAGLAEGSPFLWDLAAAEPARLLALLERRSRRALRGAAGAGNVRAVAATEDEAEAMRLLRRMKAEAALLIALADIGGVWPVMRVTRALTELADTAVGAAVRFLLREAARRGRLKPADPTAAGGRTRLHRARHGQDGRLRTQLFERHRSDRVLRPEAAALVDRDDAAAFHVRLTRGLVKLLQERTADGYVFRVDLRLRPDPASTQIAISIDAALDYYGSVGQNWERAAMIKARACAGDIAAGEAFCGSLSPFIWRKYLDFAAVADIHAMKRQIHAYRGHDDIAVEGHNIKLGRGGIREIEFFVQTQQLIAGGRHPELRGRDTLATLDGAGRGRLDRTPTRATELGDAYRFLRTHRAPAADGRRRADPHAAGRARGAGALRALPRLRGPRRLRRDSARRICARCSGTTSRLFEDAAAPRRRLALTFPKDADDRETLDRLGAHGLPAAAGSLGDGAPLARRRLSVAARRVRAQRNSPSWCRCCSTSWRAPKIRTRRSPRSIGSSPGCSAAARLFSLLRQNPDLVALVALMLGTAPRLADILARHPEVMDALLDPTFFGALPDEAKLEAELGRSLGRGALLRGLPRSAAACSARSTCS